VGGEEGSWHRERRKERFNVGADVQVQVESALADGGEVARSTDGERWGDWGLAGFGGLAWRLAPCQRRAARESPPNRSG
jgi:hypothetical protein